VSLHPPQLLRDYERALIECARIAGADMTDAPPTSPPLHEWAVRAVTELRRDYDDACQAAFDLVHVPEIVDCGCPDYGTCDSCQETQR
jgi:hypothetical protein